MRELMTHVEDHILDQGHLPIGQVEEDPKIVVLLTENTLETVAEIILDQIVEGKMTSIDPKGVQRVRFIEIHLKSIILFP